MDWASYGAFLVFAVVLTLIPGPDTAVAIKNTLQGGRRRGAWCVAGISSANLVQSTAAAAGLSVLIVTIEPLFLTLKWVGAAYLFFLAVQSFRSATRGEYDGYSVRSGGTEAMAGLRQGFVSNICNPKVIAFYLAILPQFLGAHPSVVTVALYAVTVPFVGTTYQIGIVLGVNKARDLFSRSRVRRAMDALTGAALVAFAVRLATE